MKSLKNCKTFNDEQIVPVYFAHAKIDDLNDSSSKSCGTIDDDAN